jgi:Na+-driven multidrug efflux pump
MLSLVYALCMGLGAAATAVVARRAGETDKEGAATAAAQVIVLSLVAAFVLGVACAILAAPLLATVDADDGVIAVGSRYTAIMLGGSVTIFLLFVVNAIFRSVGAPVIAMRALWLANGLNIVLAPFLVFGLEPLPKLGVTGAAIATTLSRGVGVAYQVLVLSRRTGWIALSRSHFRPRPPLMLELLRLATPASFQITTRSSSRWWARRSPARRGPS